MISQLQRNGIFHILAAAAAVVVAAVVAVAVRPPLRLSCEAWSPREAWFEEAHHGDVGSSEVSCVDSVVGFGVGCRHGGVGSSECSGVVGSGGGPGGRPGGGFGLRPSLYAFTARAGGSPGGGFGFGHGCGVGSGVFSGVRSGELSGVSGFRSPNHGARLWQVKHSRW